LSLIAPSIASPIFTDGATEFRCRVSVSCHREKLTFASETYRAASQDG